MNSFAREVAARIEANGRDASLQAAARAFMLASVRARYSYNFSWLGRPVIQYPQDLVAMQELIWQTQPDLIIEAGIAHGGSLMMSASMLALLDYCDAAASKQPLDPGASRRRVIGIDIDVRAHNRAAIEAHPLAHLIEVIEGSSVAADVVSEVHRRAKGSSRVLVCLDSNHTHEHVLAELNAYASLTSIGSYCVVFDTVIEDLPADMFPARPWGPGDNPKTAVREYLRTHEEFVIDKETDNKLLITVAPDGYLKRVR